MPGATFAVGEQKVRPGVYVRTINGGAPAEAFVPQGIGVALFKSSWGPLGKGDALTDAESVTTKYGSGGTTDVAGYLFKGGVAQVIPFRMGSGGTAATYTAKDTTATPVSAVTITAKYVGAVSMQATIRDSLSDATLRELVIYKDGAVAQIIQFTKGATGVGEPQALIDAYTAVGSVFVVLAKLADGNKTLAAITQQALTGGADPTVTSTSYTDGYTAVEPAIWNGITIDSESPSDHVALQAYVDRLNTQGKHVLTVVGEPTSVALATRMTDAKAFNDVAVGYICNGVELSDGTIMEGYKAAAYCAGRLMQQGYIESVTHDVVKGGLDIVGQLTDPQIQTAILSGAMCFSFNEAGQVQIEYGINTLVTPSADQDEGWKKWRRVKTRWALMSKIAATWDPLVGKIDNNSDGQATLIAAAQGIVNKMVGEGALKSGTVILDPVNPPSGDSAWFGFKDLVDNDSAEKMYFTMPFQYGGQ